MTISLTKPSEGATGWASAINQNWTDIENAVNAGGGGRLYIDGLDLVWSTGTAVHVAAGMASAANDGVALLLTERKTADFSGTPNTIGAYERKTLSGYVANDSTTGFTGTNTAWLTEFAPSNSPRTLTRKDPAGAAPTISSTSTAVTGSNTRFMEEVAPNDMIGNDTDGYYRVASVASDTSLTLVTTPGSAFSSDTANVLENLLFEVGDVGVTWRINAITSNTNMVADISAGNVGTFSGETAYTGGPRQSEALNYGPGATVESLWGNVWLAKGGTGTGVFWSNQRTRPFATIPGYNTSWRRLGALRWYTAYDGGNLRWCVQDPVRGNTRKTLWLEPLNGGDTQMVGNGSATTDTRLVAVAAPPTARVLWLVLQCTAGVYLIVRPADFPANPSVFGPYWVGGSSASDNAFGPLRCDASQAIMYRMSSGGGGGYVNCAGFEELLNT